MRLKTLLLGCAGALLLLTGASEMLVRLMMTPRTRGLPLSNAELQELVAANAGTMEQIRSLAMAGDVEMATRLASGLGFLALRVEGDSRARSEIVISLAVFEQSDPMGGYTIGLDHPSGGADARYRSMVSEYGNYTPCGEGWWVVRH